jgi:hypothetical protein
MFHIPEKMIEKDKLFKQKTMQKKKVIVFRLSYIPSYPSSQIFTIQIRSHSLRYHSHIQTLTNPFKTPLSTSLASMLVLAKPQLLPNIAPIPNCRLFLRGFVQSLVAGFERLEKHSRIKETVCSPLLAAHDFLYMRYAT